MSAVSQADKLVRMANQIATFFLSQPEAVRIEGVANHINKFWEPRMRRSLLAALADPVLAGQLAPIVRDALERHGQMLAPATV